MKRHSTTHVLASLLLLLETCTTVPFTGRQQLNLLSEESEIEMGLAAYPKALSQYPEISSGPDLEMLRRVMHRLRPFTGKDFDWEVRLLDAPEVVNAWALPGGKMAFYSGILPLCQGEEGVAVVMSHEMSHAIARHGGERISRSYPLEAVGRLIQVLLGDDPADEAQRKRILGLYGAAARIGVDLPFSRANESEADEIGLHLMVQAGYDPWAAVRLWQRMAKLGGSRTISLLSTHPEPADRAQRIATLIPVIRSRYPGR